MQYIPYCYVGQSVNVFPVLLFPHWIVMWLIQRSFISIEPSKHLPVTGVQSDGRWMMARPLSQILPPDLPSSGASPQFGNSSQAGGSIGGGHNSTANLKSLLQLPVKADQRVKDCCEIKGEKNTPDKNSMSQHFCFMLYARVLSTSLNVMLIVS